MILEELWRMPDRKLQLVIYSIKSSISRSILITDERKELNPRTTGQIAQAKNTRDKGRISVQIRDANHTVLCIENFVIDIFVFWNLKY